MKLNYYRDTDSLYIDLSEHASVESRELTEGVVVDHDAAGSIVGIDIDNASHKVQLDRIVLSGLSSEIERAVVLAAAVGYDLHRQWEQLKAQEADKRARGRVFLAPPGRSSAAA